MTAEKIRPNFLLIVADDLGFTDISPFGGEIDTPNLARLAKIGQSFTDFHTAPACSPTRSMLLSGTDNHIAGVGQMAETLRTFNEDLKDQPGYEGVLNQRVAALSEILKDEGYYTTISGKWHLGLTEESSPSARGFEKVNALLPGGSNHFKYFPLDSKGETPNNFMPPLFEKDGKLFHAGKAKDEIPDEFYSTKYFTDNLIDQLKSKDRDGRPFFSLLTYTAPHWPLQAPEEFIAKYKGVYDKGPAQLRLDRLKRAAELGIIDKDSIPHDVKIKYQRWETLSEENKRREVKIMEVYAAMVDYLDKQIGRVLDELEASGEIDNTFIAFMSDNGAEGAAWEAFPMKTEIVSMITSNYYNNDFDNIGKKDSFVYYSDEWAQAATAPNFLYKCYSTEGGINCPFIVSYPKLINAEKKNAGVISNSFLTVMDILPTVLGLAEVKHPGKSFHGRTVVEPIGKDFTSVFFDSKHEIHTYEDSRAIGWELMANRAIRRGDYKLNCVPAPFGSDKWELFNVKKDPGETKDLSKELPEIYEQLIHDWAVYVAETGLVEVTRKISYSEAYDELEKVLPQVRI